MDRPLFTIAYCAGRRRLVPVLEMLVRRLRTLHHGRRLQLRLAIVWDRSLEGEAPPCHELRSLDDIFEEVHWLEPTAWRGLLPAARLRDPDLRRLVGRAGFAARRNLALLEALAAGSRYLLFLDDDEYYTAPWRGSDGCVRWRPVDPLAPHLDGFARGAGITNGVVLGQPSPIPRGLADHVPVDILRRLGQALAAGSEILEAASFVAGRVCLAAPDGGSGPRPIPVVGGLRRLTGGNLAFDLIAVRAGRVPPFFAPPHARGEDAFLGALVGDLEVLRVPAYLFHDPFGRHLDVAAGARPTQLAPAPVTPATVDRFGNAFLGWLRYAPLLLRLRSADEAAYIAGIDDMRGALTAAVPELVAGLRWEEFARARHVLEQSHRRSARDLADLRAADAAWRDLVVEMMPRRMPAGWQAQRAA